MVKKDIFQNISFIKINWIIIIASLFFPNFVKADTLDDYNRIEYIKGTGTQYIDTGFKATGGMKSEYEVEYDNTMIRINGGYIVGSHNTSAPWGRNGGYYNGGGHRWELGYGDYYPQTNTEEIEYNRKYKIEFQTIIGQAYLKVDDSTKLSDNRTTTINPTGNVLIFANNLQVASNETKTRAKVYYVKIWDKDLTLVRDYIPVKRKSDDKIGMYDLVNNIFYTNVGNTNFEGGEIIPDPTPPDPTPTGNVVLDDFLTIYVDRLNYLSEKTIENQYMLAFIGIIFGFIVLEMTLHIIHIRGGYKK